VLRLARWQRATAFHYHLDAYDTDSLISALCQLR